MSESLFFLVAMAEYRIFQEFSQSSHSQQYGKVFWSSNTIDPSTLNPQLRFWKVSKFSESLLESILNLIRRKRLRRLAVKKKVFPIPEYFCVCKRNLTRNAPVTGRRPAAQRAVTDDMNETSDSRVLADTLSSLHLWVHNATVTNARHPISLSCPYRARSSPIYLRIFYVQNK